MSAQDTLCKVIDREAGKLDKLSAAAEAPLEAAHLEALAILSRCAKALRAPTVEPPDDDKPGQATDEDLERVT